MQTPTAAVTQPPASPATGLLHNITGECELIDIHVSMAIRARIQQGEAIDFLLLLEDDPASTPWRQEDKEKKKRAITAQEWNLAWAIFAKIYIQACPYLML
jgi:hypothetical protein